MINKAVSNTIEFTGEFPGITVIVFDLDGTLYEDTRHFDFYARSLQGKLPKDCRDVFWTDYLNAREDLLPIKIGTVYDVERDLILVEEENKVLEAYDWSGQAKQQEEVLQLYQEPIKIDQKKFLSIGDLWWLPVAIAMHFGATGKSCQDSFFETRKFMMQPEFEMEKVPGLNSTLIELKKAGYHLAMLTNSPEQDSEVILEKLGLESSFDMKVFSAQKPSYTKERFTEIKQHFGVEFSEILSIGDNWVNEILPAQQLGCRTILIDPHRIRNRGDADKIITSIRELWCQAPSR